MTEIAANQTWCHATNVVSHGNSCGLMNMSKANGLPFSTA